MPPPSSGHVWPSRPDEPCASPISPTGEAARRWPGRLHPAPDQGARRSRPPRRGARRPAVPGPRPPGAACQAAEPRHLQRHLPRPFPEILGDQALAGPRRDRPVLDRQVQRAARLQPESLALPRRPQARVRPRPRQPVPGLRHLGHRPLLPVLETLHHPITKDRALEVDTRAEPAKRRSVNRWYGFVKMQARVARHLPRVVVVSENSINDIHTDFGVPRENMRLVPVGVDPELFKPLPHVERDARPADHHRERRRRAEGSLVPARGACEAAHRARRHADCHRPSEAGRSQRGDDRAPRPHRCGDVRERRVRRAHRRALRRGRARGRAFAVRRLLAACSRGDGDGHRARRDDRRRAARRSRAPTARPCCRARRRRRRAGRDDPAGPRRSGAARRGRRSGPRTSHRAGGAGPTRRRRPSSSTASSSRCVRAQGRDAKADAHGRLRPSWACRRATGCSTSDAGSAATPSRPLAAALASSPAT